MAEQGLVRLVGGGIPDRVDELGPRYRAAMRQGQHRENGSRLRGTDVEFFGTQPRSDRPKNLHAQSRVA
ncbi:MAG TPA: hypothetical protein VEV63_00615 [Streptosporangiaceae bacterium]|nr:hypothetical protein [Streptosporangiaceae bacterium]